MRAKRGGRQHQHGAVYRDPQLERHFLQWLMHQAAQHLHHAQAALDCRNL